MKNLFALIALVCVALLSLTGSAKAQIVCKDGTCKLQASTWSPAAVGSVWNAPVVYRASEYCATCPGGVQSQPSAIVASSPTPIVEYSTPARATRFQPLRSSWYPGKLFASAFSRGGGCGAGCSCK